MEFSKETPVEKQTGSDPKIYKNVGEAQPQEIPNISLRLIRQKFVENNVPARKLWIQTSQPTIGPPLNVIQRPKSVIDESKNAKLTRIYFKY